TKPICSKSFPNIVLLTSVQYKLSANFPSEPLVYVIKLDSSSFSIKNAPAPSPNKTHVLRSESSVILDKTSPATTIILLYIPDDIYAFAILIAYTDPTHAALTSIAAAFSRPSLPCTYEATLGVL